VNDVRCCDAVAVNAVVASLSASSTTPLSASNSSSSNFNGSSSAPPAMLAPYAAGGFPAGADVLGMMPYFYPGLAGYYPGAAAAGIPFMQPPTLLPGT